MDSENKTRKKEDLRVTRTKIMLCGALTRLLETKALEKISIQDIATEAMINRNTFYLHFVNMAGFLEYYYSECLDDLRVRLFEFEVKSKSKSITYDYYKACMEQLVVNIDKYSFIYQNFMSKSIYTPFFESVESIISSHIQTMIQFLYNETNTIHLKLSAKYFASGLIGVLIYWMNNKKDISYQNMIDVLSMFPNRGL